MILSCWRQCGVPIPWKHSRAFHTELPNYRFQGWCPTWGPQGNLCHSTTNHIIQHSVPAVYLPQISSQWATPRSRCEGLEGMRMGQCFPLAGLAAASSEKRPLATSSGKRWGRGQQHPGWWRSGPPKNRPKPRARPLSGCQVSYLALWSSTWKVDL